MKVPSLKKPRNSFELKVYKALKKSKVKFKYESERIAYVYAGHYIPDFIIETKLGKIYIETKGYLRATDKRKMVAVKRTNPQLDIRILFYSHKKTDVRWAERNGFVYAIDKIPDDWLKGL